MFVSLLNFNIVMKFLNVQDHQAKTHLWEGVSILKKQGNHKPKPNTAFAKNEKKTTQADNNRRPSNQKKKKERKNGEP